MLAGKFELLHVASEGGMGTVWVGRNRMTGADVAIKVLHEHRKCDQDALERFEHEAHLGARLAHRNITRVFDLLEERDGRLVLVMELLHGETLEAYAKREGTLSNEAAVAIMVPILSALAHAHEQGIVHRDIKPANILLHVDPDGQVTPKLLDFGIAKASESPIHTHAGDILGTPQYMSPEQVRASQPLDGRSDLFAVGVVLYELLTGENPFRAHAPSATLAQVLELEVDPHPQIAPRLWIELTRVLSKQPYERHASASELAAALCKAVGQSEALLGESLKRDKPVYRAPTPSSRDIPPEVDKYYEPTPPADPVAVEAPHSKSSLTRTRIAIGLTLLAAVAVGAIRFVGSSPLSQHEPSSMASAARPEAEGPMPAIPPPNADEHREAIPVAATFESPRDQDAARAGANSPSVRATKMPRAVTKARAPSSPSSPSSVPIARTPGF